MSRPRKSTRLMLVLDPRPASVETTAAPVRRYRLARLRLDGRSSDPALRYEHLKRVFE